MRAKALVPILAEIYGVPEEAAFMIDRSLAECGLRAKGRGKALPEMTRREAVVFLIACMTAQKATKAGVEVVAWVNASGWINDTDDDAADDTLEENSEGPQFVRNYNMRQVVDCYAKYQRANDQSGRINFIDFLLALCEALQRKNLSGEIFKLEISVSHGWAAVSVNDTFSGGFSEVRFQTEAGSFDPVAYEHQINRTALIYGDALLALAIRTADPLAGAD